jgi:pilus assembly protein Flp/PilA
MSGVRPEDTAEIAGTSEVRPMRPFAKSVVKFVKAEDGPTAVEYAVMLALILVAVIGSVTIVGTKASGTFTTTGTSLPSGS